MTVVSLVVLGMAAQATASYRGLRATAQLSGLEEVPAILTDGFGRARFEIFADRIEYRLSIGALEGPVRFAHIHIGQRGANGGVAAFLCNNTNPSVPEGTPACPQRGVVRGTIRSADVIGPADQGVVAADLDALIQAILSGVAYVNVHSDAFPPGELRGQIEAGRSRRRGRNHD